MEINKVGVLGAGTMGGGIAQAVAQAGFLVAILDPSETLVREVIDEDRKKPF